MTDREIVTIERELARLLSTEATALDVADFATLKLVHALRAMKRLNASRTVKAA